MLICLVLFLCWTLSPWLKTHGGEPALTEVSGIELDLMWQVGGADEEFIIGFVQDAVADHDGTFYLLDQQLSRICVVNPSGSLRTTIGGEGDGPGEFRDPGSIAWWSRDEIAVAQALPGRLKLVSTGNIPGATIYYSRQGETQVTGISRFERYRHGLLFQTAVNTSNGTSMVSHLKLVRCDTTGAELLQLFEHEMVQYADHFVMDERLLTPAWSHWICSEGGDVYWVEDRDRYEVWVARPSGQREVLLSRQVKPMVRTREEIESIRSIFETGGGAFFADVEAIVETSHPVISRLTRGPAGEVWVSTSRGDLGRPDGVLFVCDSFGPDGTYLESVAMHLPDGMKGGQLLMVDWPFVLARFQVNDDGEFHSGPDECAECFDVYAGFNAGGR
jgi:hypothetical protein